MNKEGRGDFGLKAFSAHYSSHSDAASQKIGRELGTHKKSCQD
jgi:hypothetical protein